MIRVIKNPLRAHIKTNFRGRERLFKSKAGLSFDMEDEEQSALYHHWLKTYEFLYDITEKIEDKV